MQYSSQRVGLLIVCLAALLLFPASATLSCAPRHGQNSDASNSACARKGSSGQAKQDKKDAPKKSSQHSQTQDQAQPANQPAAGSAATQNTSTRNTSPRAATSALVWVNTDTKVFHKPGTKWYGKTKHGKYMTEADARRAGYRPAGKE